MSLFDLIIMYFEVKADCKSRYKRDVETRMRELLDALRMEV